MESPCPLVLLVDASASALQAAKSALAGAEIRQFRSSAEFMQALDSANASFKPAVVLCEAESPGLPGENLLEWLKRHPRWHSIPVVVSSSDEGRLKKLAEPRFGAVARVKKPFDTEALRAGYERAMEENRTVLPPAMQREADRSFAVESLSRFDEWDATFGGGKPAQDPEAIPSLFRTLHTIKGGALSLQFPTLGYFVHAAEELLAKVREHRLNQHPEVQRFLQLLAQVIRSQLEEIEAGRQLSAIPTSLNDGITAFTRAIEAGKLTAHEAEPVNPPRASAARNKAPTAKAGEFTRVPNEKLDQLQEEIRKIIQLRTRLNGFALALRSEFADEGFPEDLVKMVESLGAAANSAMDFFISFRVRSAAPLETFCRQVVEKTSAELKKPISLSFDCDPTLEIDQAIEECVQRALTHLIRNAIDHGIEDAATRTAAEKSPEGNLSVEIKNLGRTELSIIFSDDGRGIALEPLRQAIRKQNLMDEATVTALTDAQVMDMIFVDGLTTAESVTAHSGRGVGMGAVKESVTKLSGTIRVSSRPGRGTTFQITLPRIFRL